MSVLYRVVRQKYADHPLDTAGSRLNGGRWNPPGVGILYTAEHPALALVEILVHLPKVPYDELPTYRLFTLDVPDDRRILTVKELPSYWNENTYARSQFILRDWLAGPDCLALGVPSSVLPDGLNFLLHASHPRYAAIRILAEKPLVVDPRLWPG